MLMCSEYATTHGGQTNTVKAQVALLQECIQILPKKMAVAVRKVGNYSRIYQTQQIFWTLVTSNTSPSLSYKGQSV